jgi:hypothetical protein
MIHTVQTPFLGTKTNVPIVQTTKIDRKLPSGAQLSRESFWKNGLRSKSLFRNAPCDIDKKATDSISCPASWAVIGHHCSNFESYTIRCRRKEGTINAGRVNHIFSQICRRARSRARFSRKLHKRRHFHLEYKSCRSPLLFIWSNQQYESEWS